MSPDEHQEWHVCLRKNRYDSEEKALQEAQRGRKRTGHVNIVAYRCEYGEHWHIGHKKFVRVCEHCGAVDITPDNVDEHNYRAHGII